LGLNIRTEASHLPKSSTTVIRCRNASSALSETPLRVSELTKSDLKILLGMMGLLCLGLEPGGAGGFPDGLPALVDGDHPLAGALAREAAEVPGNALPESAERLSMGVLDWSFSGHSGFVVL
jgi:hypothetical protein